jgi:hypothetical protein
MARNRDSLQRRRARFEPKPRFLIVCEGTVTEPAHFKAVRHVERCLVELEINPGGAPKQLVERAVELKEQANRDARRRRDDNLKYEEVWCVFDVDDHRMIPEAKEQAQANDVDVAISNPCFELWVLLHFQDQHAYIDRGNVQHLCRTYMPGYEKRLNYEILGPKYSDAVQRAIDLEKWHDSRGTPGENPSTMIHKLVARIRAKQETPGPRLQ